MTSKLNNARNSPVINLQKQANTQCQRKQCLMDNWRVKPSLTVYDKFLCNNIGPLTVSDDQLPVGGKWENLEFSFPPTPIKPLPFLFP